jgi:hypothetical protein
MAFDCETVSWLYETCRHVLDSLAACSSCLGHTITGCTSKTSCKVFALPPFGKHAVSLQVRLTPTLRLVLYLADLQHS